MNQDQPLISALALDKSDSFKNLLGDDYEKVYIFTA